MNQLSPAEELLKDLGVNIAGDIDIEAIAYHVGAIVKYRPLNGCEGRIIGTDDRAVITVNSLAIQTRQRFSVAHELGHWHHHRGRSLMCLSDEISNPPKGYSNPERVANGYAADLLMPRFLLRPMAKEIGKVSFQAVEALRGEFKTSITATAIRLVEHGPEPAMLICHTRSGRKWFRRSPDVPAKWFPQDNLDADSSAMDVLYGKAECGNRSLIGADAWFDRWDAERYELYEETRRIAAGEILTLLVFEYAEML